MIEGRDCVRRTYRWILVGLIVVGALLGGYGIRHFLVHHEPTASSVTKVGIVHLDKLIEINPSYQEYIQAKHELEELKQQYVNEQGTLNAKANVQSSQLAAIASDSAFIQSLNDELQAKIKVKEDTLNADMQRQRQALLAKYLQNHTSTATDIDLRIVNLQLDLVSRVQRVPLNQEDAKQIADEKAAKELELKRLLAQRGPAIERDIQRIHEQVDAELKPMQVKKQQELEAYASTLRAELIRKRDGHIEEQARMVMSHNDLPSPVEWSGQWTKRIQDKEAEVNSLHEAILEDIEMRVAVIAQEKGLDLVLTDEVSNNKGIDITDELIATYKDT